MPCANSRVECRIRRHRQDLTVARVLHHHDACRRCVVGARRAIGLTVDRPARRDLLELHREGLLGELLDLGVDREHDVVAGHRRDVLQHLDHASLGVDLELAVTRPAAELAFEHLLDSRDADRVAQLIAGGRGEVGVAIMRVSGGDLLGQLSDVADHVRGEGSVCVKAFGLIGDGDAGELLEALLQEDGRPLVLDRGQRQREQRRVLVVVVNALRAERASRRGSAPSLRRVRSAPLSTRCRTCRP